MLNIVVGAAGRLGKYLSSELKKTGDVIGLDITKGELVDKCIKEEDISEQYTQWLTNILKEKEYSELRVILAIAPSTRCKDPSDFEGHLRDLKKFAGKEEEMLMKTAKVINERNMDSKKNSHIIVIGSPLSRSVALSESPIYAASKSGTKALVKYLALAFSKQRINVNMISPELLANKDELRGVIGENLEKLGIEIGITAYNDIYKTIKFISSEVESLIGQEIVLDYGLGDISSYWAIAKVLGNI